MLEDEEMKTQRVGVRLVLERLATEGRVIPARLDLADLRPPPELPVEITISEALAEQREER